MTSVLRIPNIDDDEKRQSGETGLSQADLDQFEMDCLDELLASSQQSPDFGVAFLDLNVNYVPQSIGVPLLEAQLTGEKTHTPLMNDAEPTKISPDTDGSKVPTACLIDSAPDPAVQTTPKVGASTDETETEADFESEKDQEQRIRYLSRRLQNGFLPKAEEPILSEMKSMSLYLQSLERVEKPSPDILEATCISTTLKKIASLSKIPEDDIYSFKLRVVSLLGKWGVSLEAYDRPTSSTEPRSPIDSHDTGLIEVTNELKPADVPNSLTDLTRNCVPELLNISEHSVSHHELEHDVSPASEHSLLASQSPLSAPKRLVIDLTCDNEVDAGTKPALSKVGLYVAEATQMASPLTPPSRRDSEPFTTAAWKEGNSKSELATSKTKKRKHMGDAGENALVPAPRSSKCHINNKAPDRRKRQQRTSPRKHLADEIQWMSGSVSKIGKMIEETEKDIDTITEKRAWLIKENEAEMKSAEARRGELIELKKYLLDWGAQDKKVTDEWSPLE